MPEPRLPVAARSRDQAVPAAAGPAARTRWQVPADWVDVPEAAARADVSVRTMYDWVRERRVVARRLATGTGPWRVRLDETGFPMDVDHPSQPKPVAR